MNNLKRLFLIVSFGAVLLLSACNWPSFGVVEEDGVTIVSPIHGARLNAGESVDVITEVSATSVGLSNT